MSGMGGRDEVGSLVDASFVRAAMDAHQDLRAAALELVECLTGSDGDVMRLRVLCRTAANPRAATALGDYLEHLQAYQDRARLARLPIG